MKNENRVFAQNSSRFKQGTSNDLIDLHKNLEFSILNESEHFDQPSTRIDLGLEQGMKFGSAFVGDDNHSKSGLHLSPIDGRLDKFLT